MATEATFTAAADAFDELATTLQTSFRTLDGSWSSDVVAGGRLTTVIDLALDATHGNTTSSAGQLVELAAECRRRAAVAARYTEAMAQYRREYSTYRYERNQHAAGNRPGSPPRPPQRPIRPAPWCDETTANLGAW